jgi:hypothetical protein
VSEQEYENTLALYDVGAGYRIDGGSFNGWAVRDFLDELRLGEAPRWREIVEAVSAKKRELNEWFSNFYIGFSPLGNFITDNYNKDQLIQFALAYNFRQSEIWWDEPGGAWDGELRSIDAVYIDETVELLFGIKEITREPDVTNIDEFDFESIEYRDGRYFVNAANRGSDPLYVQTVKWIDDGDGTYSALLEIYGVSIGDPYPENPYDSKELWHGWDYFNDRDVYLGNLQPYDTAAAVVKTAEYNGEQVYQLIELVDPGTIDDLTLPATKSSAPPNIPIP